ncbi:uncharacterized protein LOC118507464 isoform X2 [Anopheles stephensi]|uniref:uncharacterized protein LOC118507464 isoform X2 n=1 Tax=Anopheles stephensi TaxID=30069 RepID=UPI001658719A|nr:uncharacterized protein LOC118507464 isoform X2 [Anopheles stephensi]
MSFLKDTLASRPRMGNLELAGSAHETEEYLEEELMTEENQYNQPQDYGKAADAEKHTSSSQPSGSRPKRASDAVLLENLLLMEKERHEMAKQQKTGNYYAMMSLVTLMDKLEIEDQIEVRDEILRFGHRVLKEKFSNYKDNC